MEPSIEMQHDPDTNLDQLATKVAELERGHAEIRTVLTGDLSGRPGVMQHLLKLMEDMYGKEDKKSAFKTRLEKVEDLQQKVIWVSLGISIIVGLLWKVLK